MTPEYIQENYGMCKLDTCICLKNGWKGVVCENWVPVKFDKHPCTTLEQLKQHALQRKLNNAG